MKGILSGATRGKGTPRRKVKKVHKSSGTDDKKLQTSLKKLNVQPIQQIEEVNMFKEDGNVIHFAAPKGEEIRHHSIAMPPLLHNNNSSSTSVSLQFILTSYFTTLLTTPSNPTSPRAFAKQRQSTPPSPPTPSPSTAPAKTKNSRNSSPASSTSWVLTR